MKTIIRKSLIAALVVAFAPELTACDSGNKEEPQAQTDAKADAGAEAKPEEANAVDPAVQKEADEALSADASGLDPKVAKAVNIAKEIEADPSKAEEVLAKHELDREGLDALMYEIARSPELAKSYAAARMNS